MESYKIERLTSGVTITLNSTWSDSMVSVMKSLEITGIKINYAHGFIGDNVEFLSKLDWLERLEITSYSVHDLSPIDNLKNLRFLSIGNGEYRGLDFSHLQQVEHCHMDRVIAFDSLTNCISLKRLSIGHLLKKNLKALGQLFNLTRLDLYTSPVCSLDGLEEHTKLLFLGLYNLTKLDDITALSQCTSLEDLDIERCRKISSIEAVSNLTRLKRLRFSRCGDIKTMSPVRSLTDLMYLIFADDTNIVDGNLDPITTLRNLRYTRFKDRTHYNHKAAEFPRALTAVAFLGCHP
jgi:Leucine-rich repeat (LRR) protein